MTYISEDPKVKILQKAILEKEDEISVLNKYIENYQSENTDLQTYQVDNELEISSIQKKITDNEHLVDELQELEDICIQFTESEKYKDTTVAAEMRVLKSRIIGEKEKLDTLLFEWQQEQVDDTTKLDSGITSSKHQIIDNKTNIDDKKGQIDQIKAEIEDLKTQIKNLDPLAEVSSDKIKTALTKKNIEIFNKLVPSGKKKDVKIDLFILNEGKITDFMGKVAHAYMDIRFSEIKIGKESWWILNHANAYVPEQAGIKLAVIATSGVTLKPSREVITEIHIRYIISTEPLSFKNTESSGTQTITNESSGWNIGGSLGLSKGTAAGDGGGKEAGASLGVNGGYQSSESTQEQTTKLSNVELTGSIPGASTTLDVKYEFTSSKGKIKCTKRTVNSEPNFENIVIQGKEMLDNSVKKEELNGFGFEIDLGHNLDYDYKDQALKSIS